jgi:hypothetical protein
MVYWHDWQRPVATEAIETTGPCLLCSRAHMRGIIGPPVWEVAAAKDTRVEQDSQILFGPFRFDQTRQRLWQGPRDMRIRAKTLAVL